MDLVQLTALFARLGAREPASWARSQIEEGIPQLARYLFLRQAWRSIVSADDPTWIDKLIAASEDHPDEPYAGRGHALKRLRARGATDDELTDLVRGTQAELLFEFCYLLEDPGDLEEGMDMSWALFQTNEDGAARSHIAGLHESVLETDPTGREVQEKLRDEQSCREPR